MVRCDFCGMGVGDTVFDGKVCRGCGGVMRIIFLKDGDFEIEWMNK